VRGRPQASCDGTSRLAAADQVPGQPLQFAVQIWNLEMPFENELLISSRVDPHAVIPFVAICWKQMVLGLGDHRFGRELAVAGFVGDSSALRVPTPEGSTGRTIECDPDSDSARREEPLPSLRLEVARQADWRCPRQPALKSHFRLA